MGGFFETYTDPFQQLQPDIAILRGLLLLITVLCPLGCDSLPGSGLPDFVGFLRGELSSPANRPTLTIQGPFSVRSPYQVPLVADLSLLNPLLAAENLNPSVVLTWLH
jgi:hypothetical protein